ncbi:CDP-diacylglycerol--glycerol-3-phosphate 3-phosphatidyltransferase [Halolactibacillus alkaliphilus]|uniref:CDP-diacylglycerol--glycerol-3-phosphate 3-phosphatidyltransferase n=1 Tax=Halolactibacillus alkaliphilus TaxID=442899 RepID=A0A511X4D4_9BACI|nr:CDP-diacylglycerol--glycerol-3-phosphate 3-phosphatidyltransferase [Halolactibacillus alkaliphilus]GEN57808.1 CDP-diacylglycerol--glycerol-3-phosphate 3-phosphatidyltransferase [Halolactibacillus alkaliphilus]GGN75160.1 CDP-diacylglycerol--glycerol-3-phosphate 3-phosphatidyltransferase [Halolactibacillus alkaliphilus]SFP05073.1 CDP-diacylglycerol--glycerol-3-phosphate 3-phosphatidyltransferase [Halolactibacillus alkaliphilus]
MNIPNRITISRILLIPVFILLLTLPLDWGSVSIGSNSIPMVHLVSALIFIIASGTDWVDGYYARKYNLVTNLGKFLDPMADKLLVSAAFVLLVELGMAPAWLVIIILSREFAVTGLRLVAAGEGIVLAAGQMGKWKTTFQLVSISFLLLHDFPFSYLDLGFSVGTILLYIALILTVISGLDYFIKNWHVMKESK